MPFLVVKKNNYIIVWFSYWDSLLDFPHFPMVVPWAVYCYSHLWLPVLVQNDSATEDDDEGDDDDDEEVVTILPEDKYRVGSLEKMISVMAVLVEESRCERCVQLATLADYSVVSVA